MFNNGVIRFVDILIQKGICKKKDREIVIYGLKSGVKLLFNMLTTVVLGVIFKQIIESIVFLIFFPLIRTYAGGYHAKSPIVCYFLSSGIVVLLLAIIKYTPANYIFFTSIFLLLIGLFLLFKIAPIDTKAKLFDEVEKKYFRKKVLINLVLECTLILVMFIFNFDKIAYTISLGIFVSAGLVLAEKGIRLAKGQVQSD